MCFTCEVTGHITLHLIPRPHPREGKRIWWTWADSSVLVLWLRTDKAIIKFGSNWSLWLHLHVITTAVKQTLNLTGQGNWIASSYSCTASIVMLHSCGKLVMWLSQSCDLTGTWKFLSAGPRSLPKFTRLFSSLEVGSGDETTLYHQL